MKSEYWFGGVFRTYQKPNFCSQSRDGKTPRHVSWRWNNLKVLKNKFVSHQNPEKEWKDWLKTSEYKPVVNIENHDTIGMIALDEHGKSFWSVHNFWNGV